MNGTPSPSGEGWDEVSLQRCKLHYRGAYGAKESPDSTEQRIPLTAGLTPRRDEKVPQKITAYPELVEGGKGENVR